MAAAGSGGNVGTARAAGAGMGRGAEGTAGAGSLVQLWRMANPNGSLSVYENCYILYSDYTLKLGLPFIYVYIDIGIIYIIIYIIYIYIYMYTLDLHVQSCTVYGGCSKFLHLQTATLREKKTFANLSRTQCVSFAGVSC